MPADIRPPPPPRRLPPPTTLQLMQRWVSRHRALTAAAVAFLVTGSIGTFVYIRSKEHRRKRRAKKSSSGARTEVVVVVGAVANPLTSALYLDLERRGFVVYVATFSLIAFISLPYISLHLLYELGCDQPISRTFLYSSQDSDNQTSWLQQPSYQM